MHRLLEQADGYKKNAFVGEIGQCPEDGGLLRLGAEGGACESEGT